MDTWLIDTIYRGTVLLLKALLVFTQQDSFLYWPYVLSTLLIGLLVRPAAATLAFAMAVAIFSVHIGNGLFMAKNGYEFGLALFAIAVSLLISGAVVGGWGDCGSWIVEQVRA